VLISPLLQYSLSFSNGAQIVGLAAAMTAAVFFTMAAVARRTKADMNSLGRFLLVGAVVLMVGVVANMFLQIPAFSLALSAAFVIFSSLMIMWQIRTVIDGGETSHISAALTIFISIYNIFSSLLNILLSLGGED
ncbi:Bax inhibitor-1 family protein, partial [Neisseria dentiae]